MAQRLSIVLLLASLALGCSRAETPRAKSSPVVVAAKSVEALETTRTPPLDAIVLLEAGGSALLFENGTVRDTTDDLKVLAGGKILTLEQPHRVEKYSCDRFADGSLVVDDFDSLSLTLVDADAKERVLVPPLGYVGPVGAFSFDKQKTTVTAVLGTTVFVEVWHDEWYCGAMHPEFGNTGHRYDTKTGRERPTEAPPDLLATATTRLAKEGLEDGGVHVEQAIVHFDAAGKASLGFIFWKEATYVDGIPRTTVMLPGEKLPPPSVAAFLREHPQTIKGWSQ